ncbi:MAG: hypothetical protein DHS20C14_03590 [Phycisphaeraceae bacterium]|nr:MAG: hypothetical protein DHS20C14_03590 [Phycisphaeraceae bacterium]
MRRIRSKIVGSALVVFGLVAVASAQGGGFWQDCEINCAGCGSDGEIMHFRCRIGKHCCTMSNCDLCMGAGTCCPSIPTVCCSTGLDSGGAPFAFCAYCDPL